MKSCVSTILSAFLAFKSGTLIDTTSNSSRLKPFIVTWLIDGTNLQCCSARNSNIGSSSPRGKMERSEVIREIQQVASPSSVTISSIILNNNCDSDSDAPEHILPPMTKKQRRKHRQQNSIANVILVFDGNEDEEETIVVTDHPWFQVVITDGRGRRKDRADDYIVHHALPQLHNAKDLLTSVVHLVTADKELRKRAAATRLMNGGSMVYPPKFWKQYLPNLQQRQQQQQNHQSANKL